MARARAPQSFEKPVPNTQARSKAQELVDDGRAGLARETTGPARRELAQALTRAEAQVREGLKARGLAGDARWTPASTEAAVGLVRAALQGVEPHVRAALEQGALRGHALGAKSVTDMVRLFEGKAAAGLQTLTRGESGTPDAAAQGRYGQLAQRAALRTMVSARAAMEQASARGASGQEATRAITGTKDKPGALRSTLGATETALRTEAMRSYAEGAQAEMEALQAERYPDLARKLIETFDQRTGRDSYVAHGQVRGMQEPFTDGRHVYLLPPGRPNDRAVVIPWRKAWEKGQANEAPGSHEARVATGEPSASQSPLPLPPGDNGQAPAAHGDTSGSPGGPSGTAPLPMQEWGFGGAPPPLGKPPPPWHVDNASRPQSIVDESARSFDHEHERDTAQYLASRGNDVRTVRDINVNVRGGRNFDLVMNDGTSGNTHHIKSHSNNVELKRVERKPNGAAAGEEGVRKHIQSSIKGTGQARNIVIDVRGSGMSRSEAERGVSRIYDQTKGKIDYVRVVGDGFDLTYYGFSLA